MIISQRLHSGWLGGLLRGSLAIVLTGSAGVPVDAGPPPSRLPSPVRYRETCDASAIERLDASRIVVASDEDNVLRVYRDEVPAPVYRIDVSSHLGVDVAKPEADIEGSAWIGDRIYWITSHGNSRKGKLRSSRHRLFATRWAPEQGRLIPVGTPYRGLLRDLLDEPRLERFALRRASGRPPNSPGGLNIEGLAAAPDGGLLIGLRNPRFEGRAIVIPLLNPVGLLDGERARFGEARLLDLGHRGIASLSRYGNGYLVAAASYAGNGDRGLFRWSGGDDAPQPFGPPELSGWDVEGIAVRTENGGSVDLVIDDGTRKVRGRRCKDLTDPSERSFRVLRLAP